MEQYYYLDGNNQQQGPISPSEFRQHGITLRTKVWKQGMADWQMAWTLPELRSTDFSKAIEGGKKLSDSETAFRSGMIILQIIGTVILVIVAIVLIYLCLTVWQGKLISRGFIMLILAAFAVLFYIGEWIWGRLK
ncbi:MAG: DUF4339 domain-containing protein [Prevotellaceae bacterium]|jgi:hypothetical protein|nr:DUF4339 domain-containing protein [Prevotellaceae bacterium]